MSHEDQRAPRCGSFEQRNASYTEAYSVERFFEHLVPSAQPIVLDVGAHRGESVRFFKSIYPQCQLYSFEPDPENFAELEAVARQFSTQAICAAVGEAVANCSYYRQGLSHMGGLLPIDSGSKDSLGYALRAENTPITVEKTTLDDACAALGLQDIDILKIDVQGFERQVLEGGSSILRRTACVMVEVSLYDLYGKKSDFAQIVRLLDEAGLTLWDIANLSKNPKNLRTDWVELVYWRAQS